MMRFSKETDERREAGPLECWCLHGSVGMAADWRGFAKSAAARGIGTRAVDLWRFLEAGALPMPEFASALKDDALGQVFRGNCRALLGYSMGGRLALRTLLEPGHPWQAAVIVSANPGLEDAAERAERRAADAAWATRALTGDWADFLVAWDSQPVLGKGQNRDPQLSRSLIMRRREIARSFVDWSLGAQESLWDPLAEIEIPVLWIVGENDVKYRTLAERAAALMPRATVAIAPGAGHRVPWEADAWFAETVAHFLKTGG